MVVGVIVAFATAAAAAATVVMFGSLAAVADLQQKHGTGSKGVGERPPLAKDSQADPAADASALVALATDATGAAVSPVDGAAFADGSDDTAPADDSRAPTSPLIGAAEGAVPLVAGSTADISTDAAATADDANAPPTDAAKGTVPSGAGAAVNAAVPPAQAGALVAPPHRRSGENSTAGRRLCCRYRRRCRAR